MKYSLTAFIVVIYLSSCTKTPEQKAHAVINEELRTTLHDYKSYESVKWGKVDTAYSALIDNPIYKMYTDDFDEKTNVNKTNQDLARIYVESSYTKTEFNYYQRLANSALQSMKDDYKSMDSLTKLFKPMFVGWKIEHSFRAKNLVGNLGIHHYVYYLDSAITRVVKSVDISESATKDIK